MTDHPSPRSAILLVIDRLGTGCLGPYGSTWVETPNFNALAARSTLLENMIADSPELAAAYCGYLAGCHALEDVNDDRAANLLRHPSDAGVRTSLVTDEPLVADLSATERFDAKLLLNVEPPTTCAEEVEETGIAKLFAEAIDALQRQDAPFCLTIHAQGLSGPWDAPLALRHSLAADDDPDPWPGVDVPSLRLPDDFDPDELLPIVQAYAGQVMLLDMCLGILMDAIDQHPCKNELLTIVTSPRGFPLGEHHIVGDCESQLYGELLHVPCFLWRGDGQGALHRSHALAQSPDIAATLLDWFGLSNQKQPASGHSLLSLAETTSNWPRDRAMSSCGDERTIRTPAWFYRRSPWNESVPPGESPCELFRKPDDRWEVNEISRRCPQIVEQLNVVMDDCEAAIRTGNHDLPPLTDELVEGID